MIPCNHLDNSSAAFYWTNIDVCSKLYPRFQDRDAWLNSIPEVDTLTVAEFVVATLCACLPTMHVLVADMSPGRLLRSIASKVSLQLRTSRKRSADQDFREFDSLQQFEASSGENSAL